jgi:EAL domain-containing protein (putative c-di-GMP-specific phosphodiesterase class I)
MQNVENSIQIIKRLHNYGIQIFLDDFGSGYSSLNWLKILPVQALKIDRFFIQHIVNDPFDAAIVKAIISMAHSLNIKVIAEGVETSEQLNFLKSIRYPTNKMVKCDEVQGYLFSKPVSAGEFTKLLRSQKRFSE